MEINIVDWTWGENKSLPTTKTSGKARNWAAPLSSASCCPGEQPCSRAHLSHSPTNAHHGSLHPALAESFPLHRKTLVSMHISFFPHLAVSSASFILAPSKVTGLILVFIAGKKKKKNFCQKISGTLLFLLKGKRGARLARDMYKAMERVVVFVSLLNPFPITAR